jgi:hypothetical protein
MSVTVELTFMTLQIYVTADGDLDAVIKTRAGKTHVWGLGADLTFLFISIYGATHILTNKIKKLRQILPFFHSDTPVIFYVLFQVPITCNAENLNIY